MDAVLLPLSLVRRTEQVCPRRVDEVTAMIRRLEAWTHPICIEGTVGALLDGHHRFAAARRLGLTRVPVIIFDYGEVELASWRDDVLPTRAEVLARALSGDLYPVKTTRHVYAARIMRPIPLAGLIDRGARARADLALHPPGRPRPSDLDREARERRRG